MTWFHRVVLVFFGLLAVLWVGHSISSLLSLCRISHPLASPLFVFEASLSRYQAPFLVGLLLSWFWLSRSEAQSQHAPTRRYLQRNLHGVFALLSWLAFPMYKLLYLSLWGLFALKHRRPQRLTLACLLGFGLAGLSQSAALQACVAPPVSTERNKQQVMHMLAVYRQAHGRYPAHWHELKSEIPKTRDFVILQNPYDPQREAVIDFNRVVNPRWAGPPHASQANRYTDVAGFRLYHQWWRSPEESPRDQGILVYRQQSPQQYALYTLNTSGELSQD